MPAGFGLFLLFYAKRHPHPKFRPKFGELVLVGMIFFGISIALTAMTSGLFEQENLDEKTKQAKKRKSPMRSTGGAGVTPMLAVEAPRKTSSKKSSPHLFRKKTSAPSH